MVSVVVVSIMSVLQSVSGQYVSVMVSIVSLCQFYGQLALMTTEMMPGAVITVDHHKMALLINASKFGKLKE